ncbi:MAG: ABC transporter permease [Armatimonadota bacterium]
MDRHRLGHIIRKEFTRIRRDPATMRLLFVAPLLQLILFGYAATNDVRNVRVAVFDGDRSPESRLLIQEVGNSYYFLVLPEVSDSRDLGRLLQKGTAQLALNIPPDFSRQMARGEAAQVGLLVDGSDSNTAGLAGSYLIGLLGQRGLRWQREDARREGLLGQTLPSVTPETRVWYNADLKSSNFMVPGVFGMILVVITINLAALSVVREREVGTLEQLMVTPLRNSELLLGKMIPLGLIGYFESVLIVLLALLWFHVPFRGSFVLLFAMAPVFLISNLAMGLLVSVTSRTQQEAQIVAFLILMPQVLLSGFMFPIQNMPQAIQYVTYLIPFRYFLEIVRALFLKGVGVGMLWPQMLILTVFAVGLSALAVATMRRRL